MPVESLAFKAAFGMHNAHVQTIFGRIIAECKHKNDLRVEEEVLSLPDGDFLELAWHPRRQFKNSPIVIIFPGLGGNLEEGPQYKELIEKITMAGWRGLFVHFRGCGQKKSDFPNVYHNADVSQIDAVIQYLKSMEPNTIIAAIGVSSGGALLAKWLENPKNKNLTKSCILISPAFDIGAISYQKNWYIKYYLFYFLKPYRESLVKKFTRVKSEKVELDVLKNAGTMLELDNALYKLYGCSSVDDYYKQAKPNFGLINSKLTIIHDENDPLVPKDSIPMKDIVNNNYIMMYLTQSGGHGGFIGRGTLRNPFNFWMGSKVVDLLKDDLPLSLVDRKSITKHTKSFFKQRIKKNAYDIASLVVLFGILNYLFDLKGYGKYACLLPIMILSLNRVGNLATNLYNYRVLENDQEKSMQLKLT